MPPPTPKPCRTCGTPKTGRSPNCPHCRRDKQRGATLTNDPEWVQRQTTKTTRPNRKPTTPQPGLHWCSGCRDWLHPRWFLTYKDLTAGKPIPTACRPCRSAKHHTARIKKQFGLTPDDYTTLLQLQGGGCAICGGTPKTSRLAVDHDHTITSSNNIRGLLCSKCNQELLGGIRHSARLAARAAWYLTNPPAITRQPVPDPPPWPPLHP